MAEVSEEQDMVADRQRLDRHNQDSAVAGHMVTDMAGCQAIRRCIVAPGEAAGYTAVVAGQDP